jgi:hypothetical protein
LREVDPYAMAQIRIDLWPDIAFGDTTVRQEIVNLLHTGDKNAWAEAEKGTKKYEILKQLYSASREYYRRHHDKASQLDNMEFLNEYSEYNSETPTGVQEGLMVGLWKIKGTDKYIPLSYKEAELAQKVARQEGRDEIMIARGVDPKTKKERLIPIEPVITDPAEIKGRLSFAPRANRRMINNSGWSKAQQVGALNNAIVNLFSSSKFHPKMMKAHPELVDWETIAKLKAPLSFYNRQAVGIRGNYLLGWEDDKLLKLYRMFTSVLPSVSEYEDEKQVLLDELKETTDQQQKALIKDKINKLQEKIDNPPSPNREEWDRNYVNGKSYPARVASPSDQLENMTGNIGNLYLYKYIGPNPELHTALVKSPRKYEKDELQNYKFIGPLKDIVELGVVGELKKIEDIIDKAREELKRGDKDIVNADSPAEDVENIEVTEGIVTSPATIMVNGNPFKLHFGDRLIIDNVKKTNSQQK